MCIHMQKDYNHTHVKDPVVHVRVEWNFADLTGI